MNVIVSGLTLEKVTLQFDWEQYIFWHSKRMSWTHRSSGYWELWSSTITLKALLNITST